MVPIRRGFVGLCATLLFGCGLSAPRAGELVSGTSRPIARAVFEARVRHTDVSNVPVFFPANADGTADASPGARPALVMIQGGLVPAKDYDWLAQRLADRGYVVAVPEHALELAIFSPDNGEAARQLLASGPEGSLLDGLVDPSRIAVGGHSLGGVVAAKLAVEGQFDALVLMASYPDPADVSALPNLEGPTLVVAGEDDCEAPLDEVLKRNEPVPEPKLTAILSGATHYQFTASDQKDRDRDCAPAADLATSHERIATTVGLFLDSALTDGTTGRDQIAAQEGVEVR